VLIVLLRVPDDRDHPNPANLQNGFIWFWGAGPRQSRFLRKENADDVVDHSRFDLSVSFSLHRVIFWRIGRKISRPTEINKIAIGSLIAVTGMLSLVIGARSPPLRGKVSIGWLIAFHGLNSGRIRKCLSGFTRAFNARVAPLHCPLLLSAFIIWRFFAGNNLVGWIGGLSRKNARDAILASHAGLAGIAGVIFLLAGKLFGHLLAPSDNPSAA